MNKNLNFMRFSLTASAAILLFCPISVNALYEVKRGDSLSAIAAAKYGKYDLWKSLWKANKNNIPNPNLIFPGQRLSLVDISELDLYATNDITPPVKTTPESKTDSVAPKPYVRKKQSLEWRLLPTQPWEKFVFKIDRSVDADGFDRRSRVADRIADKTNAEIAITSERIPILGEIVGARSEFERMFIGETVFIRNDETLQVGQIYSVTTGPQRIKSPRDSRIGFAYDLTGKIRIVGVRDGVFIGTVVALYHSVQRHQLLIPVINAYEFKTPTVATSPITANVVVTKLFEDDLLGEQKVVFLDVGKDDGVKVGNIFRHYLHTDPGTNETISTKDFMIESELQVLDVQDKFSVAVIMRGRNAIHFGDEVIALTDLSDYEHHQGLQGLIQEHDQEQNVDTLDQMDPNDGLGERENQELRQLEKWSKPAPAAPLQPETANGEDEIKRVNVHENERSTVDIGKETAPNDGSDNSVSKKITPQPTPVPTPEPVPEPTPESTPESSIDSTTTMLPPPPDEVKPDQEMPPKNDTILDSSGPVPTGPAPIEETPTSPSEPANGKPSGDDPFNIPPPPN